MNNVLLPHQNEALLRIHNGCILRGDTGGGKTITSLAYYNDVESPERLIVITTAKKRDSGDWQAEARILGIFPEVDSWQNISRYENVKGAFFIFDEQRVVGSGPWVSSFLKITKRNRWILLSATPGDCWLDYIPIFLGNGFYKTRLEFLREHVVWKPFVPYPVVDRYLGEKKLERLLHSILVEMPYEKHTIRHEKEVFCEYDREKYDTVWRRRWNEKEERPIQNVSELFHLMRRIVNTDPTRAEQLLRILNGNPKVIIFYNFDYELEILRELCGQTKPIREEDLEKTGGNSGSTIATAGEPGSISANLRIPESFAVAEWNGHKHEKIPENENWVYLVQYASGSEGWNCTETDTMVFWSLTYSYRMFEQAKGRIDRLDTSFRDLWYYVLRSPAAIDRRLIETLSEKRNFNEARFLREEI